MEGFERKERGEADGGVVNEGKKVDMTYTEYSRANGSDGFSKNGGDVRSQGK